jgi:hypothetical protein
MEREITPNMARKWKKLCKEALAEYRVKRTAACAAINAYKAVKVLKESGGEPPVPLPAVQQAWLDKGIIKLTPEQILNTRWSLAFMRVEAEEEEAVCAAREAKRDWQAWVQTIAGRPVVLGAAWSARGLKNVQNANKR